MDSDWILIVKMKQGEDAAWEAFVRKYYGDILKYCHFHCQNRDFSEDLTQEVFLKFFAALPNYHHLGKVKNYLYTIAANLCRDFAARNDDLPLDPALDIPAAPSDAMEEHLALEAAIRQLPEPLQSVVLLHYYQGLTLLETAAILKIGLPLAKYRLRRAKELLRKELEHGSA